MLLALPHCTPLNTFLERQLIWSGFLTTLVKVPPTLQISTLQACQLTVSGDTWIHEKTKEKMR